jgi:hypothetical protein
MSQASTPNREWPRKRAPKSTEKPKRRYLIWLLGSTAILLLSGLGIAWATGYFDPDPRILAINQLGDQLQDPNLSDKQRRDMFRTLRKDMRALPDDLRKSLEAKGREMWLKREAAKYAAFFAMSAADQQKALQKDLDDMMRRQKEREERKAEADADKAKSDSAAQNSNNQGQGGGGWGSMTDQQRADMRKRMLDNTTPEFRAERSLYRQMLQSQAASQGLPVKWNGGFAGSR